MKVALLPAIFMFLAVLPLPAFAPDVGATTVSLYVYDEPDLSVSLLESDGKLLCSWDITDRDEGDSFSAQVVWTRNGVDFASESVDCGTLKNCAALNTPNPAVGETWKCSVVVTDSYGGKGSGSAEFSMTPLGFFGGWLRGLLSLFGLA